MMTFIIFNGYDRKQKAERRRLPDDMFCNTCKSTLLTHFFRNSCFTKKLVVYHPVTNLSLASVGILLITETLIIILATKRSVSRVTMAKKVAYFIE